MLLSDTLVWYPQSGGYVENGLWSQSSKTRLYVKEVIVEVGQWVRRLIGKRGEERLHGRMLHEELNEYMIEGLAQL